MDPIIIRASRWRQITPLLICLGLLIVSMTYGIKTNSMLLMTLPSFIFGSLVAYFLEQFWENPKRLVIDEKGIWHAGWMIKQVQWNELRAAFVKSADAKEYLCFTANDREALRQRMTSLGRTINDASRASGFGDLSLNTTGYNFSSHEVVEFANKRISES